MASRTCRILSVLLVSLAALGATAGTAAAESCGYGPASAEVCGVDRTVVRGQPLSGGVAKLSINTDLAGWVRATIDWGDGTSEDLDGFNTHTYAKPGVYTTTVTGYGQGRPPNTHVTGSASGTGTITVLADAAPKLATLPSVSGIRAPGETLTADPGTWDPPEERFEYQWQRCNADLSSCAAIGSDSKHLLLTEDEAGRRVRVKVTAINEKGRRSATSYSTVAIGKPRNTVSPTVSGTRQVGQELTADPGTWLPDSTLPYVYEWLRCDAEGRACTTIGTDAATYTLTGEDRAKRIRVRVTAENAIAKVSALSYPTKTIGQPVNSAVPVVSGVRQIGETLSTGTGTWEPGSDGDYGFQWLRCNSVGRQCQAIEGATGSDYVLLEEDRGSRIRARVTATNGAGAVSALSYPSAEIGRPRSTKPPLVTGVTVTGQTLTADPGEWDPAPLYGYSYSWQRCAAGKCTDIPGYDANDSNEDYTLTDADSRKSLRVLVWAYGERGTVQRASALTAIVDAPIATTKPSISGAPAVGAELTADRGQWSPAPVSWRYHWQRCDADGESCERIGTPDAEDDRDYTPVLADAGMTLRFSVYGLNAAGPATAVSAPTAPVKGPPLVSEMSFRDIDGITVFTEPVTGVTADDFLMVCGTQEFRGTVIRVASEDGGVTWTATIGETEYFNVYYACGTDTVVLKFVDDDSVVNADGIPVGGPGAGNGSDEVAVPMG